MIQSLQGTSNMRMEDSMDHKGQRGTGCTLGRTGRRVLGIRGPQAHKPLTRGMVHRTSYHKDSKSIQSYSGDTWEDNRWEVEDSHTVRMARKGRTRVRTARTARSKARTAHKDKDKHKH